MMEKCKYLARIYYFSKIDNWMLQLRYFSVGGERIFIESLKCTLFIIIFHFYIVANNFFNVPHCLLTVCYLFSLFMMTLMRNLLLMKN